ncbi:MAG TPA: chromate ion family chromate transporter, partial [Paraburkholderia sp.]|nr:chromate ion family chromate transporter [Paraburkholderia sp.]
WTSAVLSELDFAIAVISFFLLTRWKIPPLAIVVLCALAGIAEASLH